MTVSKIGRFVVYKIFVLLVYTNLEDSAVFKAMVWAPSTRIHFFFLNLPSVHMYPINPARESATFGIPLSRVEFYDRRGNPDIFYSDDV